VWQSDRSGPNEWVEDAVASGVEDPTGDGGGSDCFDDDRARARGGKAGGVGRDVVDGVGGDWTCYLRLVTRPFSETTKGWPLFMSMISQVSPVPATVFPPPLSEKSNEKLTL
jgi:hypothetical protein